jgi:membrane-bound metal-dependent hydrolase YbcI (DUF457 family)
MDPVSHVVIGRSLEYTRQRGPTEKGRRLAVVLGALAPDIDAALMPIGFDRYLAAHEIGTHAVIGVITCAGLAALVTRILRRGSRLRTLAAAALVGASSHLAADLLTGATIRVGWPLIETRVANVGAFAMGDPLVGAASLTTLVLWWWLPRHRRRLAIILLVVLAAGAAAKSWSRVRALRAYHESVAAQASDGALLIEPVWGSPFEWRILDRTGDSVRAWAADSLGPNARLTVSVPRFPAENSRALDAVARSRSWDTVRHLNRAHDFTFATVTSDASTGVVRVLWSDLRYCDTPPSCAIRAGGDLSPSGDVRLVVLVGNWLQTR